MKNLPTILNSKLLKEVLDRRLRYAQNLIADYWKSQGKKNQHYISVEAAAQLFSMSKEEIYRQLDYILNKK